MTTSPAPSPEAALAWQDPDVARLFLGEYLGGGVARRVFAYRLDPLWVVKVEFGEYDFQNVAEWDLWHNSRADLQAYLAPCSSISPGGKALLQRRCEPCPRHLIPAKMPRVLGDLHAKNFGILDGRVVAVDYGRHNAYAMSANAKAMRKVTHGTS